MITQSTELVFKHGPAARSVAVIVPLHNYSGLVREALDSVASQTFRDIVLVVVDDRSTDDSLEVARRWMEESVGNDLSLRLYQNRHNARLAITRNIGISTVREVRYVFFLDADNMIYPRCIEKHVAALESHPEALSAHSIIEKFGDERGVFGVNCHNREKLKRGNYIDAMAMFDRARLEALGGYRNIIHGWEDYDLWLRLCGTDDQVIHIPEILSRYRVHGNSMLRTKTNVDRNARELRRLMSYLHPWIEL